MLYFLLQTCYTCSMKNSFKQFKNGFTLAEVLITLVIIGVVAAMTIPTLVNNTQKQELVSGLKKANSVLSQAVYKIGQNKGYPVGDYSFFNDADFADEFAKVISVTKKCNSFVACFGKDGVNQHTFLTSGALALTDGKAVVASDGQAFLFSVNTGKYGISQEDEEAYIGRILVDVNGHKNPNKLGYDTFAFYLIDKKGIIPAGNDSTANCSKSASTPGWACTAKVLKENAINY